MLLCRRLRLREVTKDDNGSVYGAEHVTAGGEMDFKAKFFGHETLLRATGWGCVETGEVEKLVELGSHGLDHLRIEPVVDPATVPPVSSL